MADKMYIIYYRNETAWQITEQGAFDAANKHI
jgi:hypothetical protein